MPSWRTFRRSDAYGLAAAIVLLGSLWVPMSTPEWYGRVLGAVLCLFAGLACYFKRQEKRSGESTPSLGFLTLLTLVIVLALLILATLFF